LFVMFLGLFLITVFFNDMIQNVFPQLTVASNLDLNGIFVTICAIFKSC